MQAGTQVCLVITIVSSVCGCVCASVCLHVAQCVCGASAETRKSTMQRRNKHTPILRLSVCLSRSSARSGSVSGLWRGYRGDETFAVKEDFSHTFSVVTKDATGVHGTTLVT